MKNYKWVLPLVVFLSVLPISLNFLLNKYFEKLDTERYEKQKNLIETRRYAEKMFPELKENGLFPRRPSSAATETEETPAKH